jgi:hypothetical protein
VLALRLRASDGQGLDLRGGGQPDRPGVQPQRADQHHRDGHEDQAVGDGRDGDLVGGTPLDQLGREPVRGAVGERGTTRAIVTSGRRIRTRLILRCGPRSPSSRIFAKTGSRDRVAAIGYAQCHGIG